MYTMKQLSGAALYVSVQAWKDYTVPLYTYYAHAQYMSGTKGKLHNKAFPVMYFLKYIRTHSEKFQIKMCE